MGETGTCGFPTGTRIFTDHGLVPIERIKVGYHVKTHRGRYRKVIGTTSSDVSEDLVEIKYGKHILRATGNHPIFNGASWRPASSFAKGHRVCVANLGHMCGVSHVPIETVVLEEDVRPHRFSGVVYNFAVDEDESYIAEGFVVHN
jgi:intein/homing endonuclease